jgi:hypothetical protein
MAHRPDGYGLTAELNKKKMAKYSEEDQQLVVSRICAMFKEGPPSPGHDSVQAWLKDGVRLCAIINVLAPGSVAKVNNSSMAFKQMENIGKFLDAIEEYGVIRQDKFQTVDLYEGQNMMQVYFCLFQLSSKAITKKFQGPQIGVKLADANKRDFSEDKLREGRNVIGLQMGTNKMASQSGMTAYGTGRQLTTDMK